MNWLVVIPSIRSINLDYLAPLGAIDTAVIDDSDGNISKSGWPSHVRVFDYADRRKIMGDAEWLIPRKNPSCKNLGLAIAWREGYDGALLLDDDCDLRVTPDFLERIPVGREVEAWEYAGEWLNTLDLLREPSLYARGFPYELRGQDRSVRSGTPRRCRPLFNEGLWCGTPDINGVDKLREKVRNTGKAIEDDTRRCDRLALVRAAQLLPLSIMNVQIHRDLIPAFYQPPDYELPSGWLIRRHDDVWSCLVLKTLMDIRGDQMTAGYPICWHRKAGNMEQEVVSEHVTNLIQPHLQALVRRASSSVRDLGDFSYAEAAARLGTAMSLEEADAPSQYRGVLADYGRRISAWSRSLQGAQR